VSIDLVVRDDTGGVLLGRRSNAPARGWWFVPGGVIRKNESLDTGFAWIACGELGLEAQHGQARFLGVYEHFYDDNAGGEPGFGTHYVVLGYALHVESLSGLPPQQHSEYRWFTVEELLHDAEVHDNTKAYFR
jgi:colanic acid biosynthesis protein WcaH